MSYTKLDLLQDLADMGLTGQETILIHSSMKSIGPVDGGADTVLDALMEFFRPGLLLVDFSKDFAVTTKAPTYGKINQLRLFIDKSSIEAIDADGKMAMTNLVFPTKPYNKVKIQGKGKYQIYNIK